MTAGVVDAAASAAVVRERLRPDAPRLGLVLGSGLGGLARRIEQPRTMPYGEIPGFAAATVPGHAGQLVAGTLAGIPVVACAGRLHLYEGHPAATAGFPVRVLHALGAPAVLLSNAAGGIRRTLRPGDLMVVNDHLNLSWRNPLVGTVVPGDARFPDLSSPYDPGLRALLHESARAAGVALHDGVYAMMTGPSYETPAEVRMLERLGADAVGMSTVPEVLAAVAMGLPVVAVSCITNVASGLSSEPVEHDDVLRVTATASEHFEAIVLELLRRLPPPAE